MIQTAMYLNVTTDNFFTVVWLNLFTDYVNLLTCSTIA